MKASASISRRLTASVLFLELFAAIVLIATVTNHERNVRFEAFDANLRATANALLGAVQEADSNDGSIRLDLGATDLPSHAVYRVTADEKQVLGQKGDVPSISDYRGAITKRWVTNRPYRFYVLQGERVVDPGSPRAVVHRVNVIYGLPEGHTWHEIFEATRYFAFATLVFLGITALLLSWLIRRFLRPIRELAQEAEQIDSDQWTFHAPASSKRFIELRPLAAAIEKTVIRLHRSFEQQRRFTSDAAHELKTELAIVKSSIQLLKMKRRTAEEYEQGLALGLNDIARLESTVAKMLTLARLEQSPKADRQSCDLAAAIEEAVAQIHSFADIKQVEVITNIPQIRMEVPLNREDCVLLCSNVLMNAIHFSPAMNRVNVSALVEEETVTLRFRDYGEGISEEDRPFLFEAFYRGDASRSRKSGGTGLGLSICKAICDRIRGSIRIYNHPQGGAEVEIKLPVPDSRFLKN